MYSWREGAMLRERLFADLSDAALDQQSSSDRQMIAAIPTVLFNLDTWRSRT